MNTLIIKNFLKKQTLFAVLIAFSLCGTVTAMNDINENNIGQVSYSSIKNLIYQNGSSVIQKLASCITQDNIKKCCDAIECILEKDASYAKKFASYITQDNIKDNHHAISFILRADKSYVKTFASYITQDNIKDCDCAIECIIENDASYAKKFASCITQKNFKDNQYVISCILQADKSYAKTFASYITQDNFKDNLHAIQYILQADKSYAKTFASYITQENIKDIHYLYIITAILQADQSCAKTFASYITQENFKDFYLEIIYCIIKADQSCSKTFTSYITQENFKDNLHAISCILQADQSCAKTFASYITQENFKDNLHAIQYILQADKSCAKTFASYITQENFKDNLNAIQYILQADKSYAKTFASYITQENIKDVHYLYIITAILQADLSCARTFASYITHDNYFLISQEIYELLVNRGLDLTKKLNKLGFPPKNNSTITIDPLTTYLCAGNKFNTLIYITKKSNIATKLEPTEKSLENQHFAISFEKILNFFGSKLDSIDVRYSLNDIKKQSILGLKKGRNYICHGRNSEAFVCNNVFKKILEIYYGQPIKKNWYIMHHKFPDQYPTYDRALEIKKLGNSQANNHTEERNHMQFASDLFGTSPGGSALEFTLNNANVSIGSSLMPIEKMFELLAVELGLEKDALQKYYLRYKECFDMLELLGKKFKHGTLLMYLLDKEILATFTYVTHDAYGMKQSPIAIEGIGKTFESNDVLDTLLHNPENFIDKDGTWEYVFVMSQDHPTDKNKLGSANPFNPGIDIYSFNFGEDKKIAQIIKKGIDILFYNRIIPDMIKDGVIKDTGAFKKETINFEEEIIISKL